MHFTTALFTLGSALLLPQVAGHAVVTTPAPRVVGTAVATACGPAVSTKLASDIYGPIENSKAVISTGYNATACHLFFCRGYQYSDNAANTRVYPSGTVVNFKVSIEAHHTGYANVSVVDLVKQTTIGTPLFNWPVYANSSLGPADWPKNQTDFNVTVPSLGTKCATGGLCAIQWFWYATENSQTYESCVDFTQ
ncbi:hypothetical protein FRB94_013980 [Tulasnella sp. JGI-2019a]|nr:hypothetical protein FRB93_001998 [Tulasnella sp. JGI-2019a]KAG9007745.1 hypothetical protein FRB94_013980 [Tulasnella sp. JGI-2019a]KAG9028522.1 hypothetical protein FRB95_006383 [Tulasnella sp. JGI-2019a]